MHEILTEEQIEQRVRKLPTAQRRINARRKLRAETNQTITDQAAALKDQLRAMRSRPESEKRELYARISRLEQRFL